MEIVRHITTATTVLRKSTFFSPPDTLGALGLLLVRERVRLSLDSCFTRLGVEHIVIPECSLTYNNYFAIKPVHETKNTIHSPRKDTL